MSPRGALFLRMFLLRLPYGTARVNLPGSVGDHRRPLAADDLMLLPQRGKVPADLVRHSSAAPVCGSKSREK